MASPLCACLSSTHQDPGGALTSLHGGDLIFSVDGVVSAEEAARLVAFGEASGFATQFHEADDEVTFRHNDRLAIADEAFAAALWERLRRHLPRLQLSHRSPTSAHLPSRINRLPTAHRGSCQQLPT